MRCPTSCGIAQTGASRAGGGARVVGDNFVCGKREPLLAQLPCFSLLGFSFGFGSQRRFFARRFRLNDARGAAGGSSAARIAASVRRIVGLRPWGEKGYLQP